MTFERPYEGGANLQQPPPLPGVEAPRRGPVMGPRFAVATDHPLATMAAIETLSAGGNAIDAAIAASAVNVVTKPNRTHLGGDAFVLTWQRHGGHVECLNAGGRAPRRATLAEFAGGPAGEGPRACTVPGLVDAWCELHHRHGTRPLPELLAPALRLCEDGFPVSEHLAAAMASLDRVGAPALRQAFWKDGTRPYAPGERFRQPQLAATLARIAADGRRGFYEGATGAMLAAAMARDGGLLTPNDLQEPAAHWHDPLQITYRGHTVYEQALPSQGIVLLQALKTVEHFPLAGWGPGSADAAHVMVEATRLAFADARRHAADPDFEPVPVDWLLSDEHAQELAARIDLRRAAATGAVPIASDTTSFVVADTDTVVCFIQSVFAAWGSRYYVPEAGVLMNNRMMGFHLDPASPNRLEPGKRTVHTLNNFLVVKDGALVVGGGTPGADFQVQTNLQVIAGVVDWGLDLQSSLETPRWATATGGRLNIESRAGPALLDDLRARGHLLQDAGLWGARASSQVVASLPDGGWAAATDPRGEGVAIAW